MLPPTADTVFRRFLHPFVPTSERPMPNLPNLPASRRRGLLTPTHTGMAYPVTDEEVGNGSNTSVGSE